MSVNIIGPDIKLMRARYDEALAMRGVPAQYQYPLMAESNVQGETVVDSYSDFIDTHVFFDGTPKVKTFKRLGWVVENSEDLPFLIHCSFQLPFVQKDSIFMFGGGHYSELPDRKFRVTEITYDLQAPDHLICQVIPIYGDNIVGRTKKETSRTFNKSNYFLNTSTDYRGHYHVTKEDTEDDISVR